MPRQTPADLIAAVRDAAAGRPLPEPDDEPAAMKDNGGSMPPPPAATVGLPLEAGAQLVQMIEKLFERMDKGEHGAVDLLKQALEQNGKYLKTMLSPDNRLHPDISDLNPLGERDHPKPKLRVPCFFLGVPLDQPSLTRDEIDLLNKVVRPLEHKGKRWRIALLSDNAGGQAVYISVPFSSFDDLRALEGGWQRVVQVLLGEGVSPNNQDTLLSRIEALEKLLASQSIEPPTIS